MSEIPFDWIGTVLVLLGIYLNANKKMSCWYVWFGSNIIWAMHWWPQKEYAALALLGIQCLLNVYGIRKWSKSK